ncbi:hypothetical protein REMIM1_PE00013 (plasmid) [Rhizobium etli bv. mimosae str. Mim1]|nr:hypothetical protein REMIM1_PE00013 [Rhizobium etli bv. mimosae str. Mim1]
MRRRTAVASGKPTVRASRQSKPSLITGMGVHGADLSHRRLVAGYRPLTPNTTDACHERGSWRVRKGQAMPRSPADVAIKDHSRSLRRLSKGPAAISVNPARGFPSA